jgi:RNA polymerase sigma factor (sigma-70 family)
VTAVINRFDLTRSDAADVNQTVWLRLVEHLGRLREPAALPGWIAQTTRHECLRVVQASRRTRPFDPLDRAGEAQAALGLVDHDTIEGQLLRAERRQALREAYAELPARCQQLMTLLLRDPPVTYEEISEQLSIPLGSVGPTRGRCVDKLRNCRALVDFVRSGRVTARVPHARAGAPAETKGGDHVAAVLGR